MQALIAALACLLALAAPAQAQVAQVVESKGTSLVERAGAAPRVLGANEKLDRRDTVRVARGSWVILEFTDRTRITLRPDTVFRIDAYEEGSAQSMLTGLLKGGLRAVTGLIGKQNPDGVKIQTATATIGIRGTEFDARLCEADCTREEQVVPTVTAYARDVAARVVELKGFAAAAAPGGGSRLLAPGAALYEGDGVATGPGGYAVLVFRDGARVSMEGNSRLAINRFRYRESAPADGSAYLTLYAGQAHVWTGRLAKISPDAFLVRSAIGVIRPHGTGFSVSGCIGSACGSVSGNVSSSGASGSASGSAGNTSASASGSANSSGASGSTSASAGGNTASASGSAGSGGASASFVNPIGSESFSADAGGASRSSSSPLGSGQTTVGPGGLSINRTGANSSSSLNVGGGGVSASTTQNLPGGGSVTVGGSAGPGGASASANTPLGSASENVSVGSGGMTRSSSSSPLGSGQTTVGPGGLSINRTGANSSSSLNVGGGGVSASTTQNLPGGGSVASLPSPPGGGNAAPPPPPPPSEVASTVQDAGQDAANKAQNTANAAATNTQNAVNTVMQGAQDVVNFVSRETQTQANAATQKAGQLGQAAQGSFAAGTQLAISKVQDTFSQGAQAAGQQAADAKAAADAKPAGAKAATEARASAVMGELRAVLDRIKNLPDSPAGQAVLAQARDDLARISSELNAIAALTADPQLRSQLLQMAVLTTAVATATVQTVAVVALVVGAIVVAGITGGAVTPATLSAAALLLESLGVQEAPVVARQWAADTGVITDNAQIALAMRALVINLPATASAEVRQTVAAVIAKLEQDAGRVAADVSRRAAEAKTAAEAKLTEAAVKPARAVALAERVRLRSQDIVVQTLTLDGNNAESTAANRQDSSGQPGSVTVLDGEVEVMGRGRVRRGEMLASAGGPVRVANLPAVQDVKFDADVFGGDRKGIDAGLYVWVRDGAVQLAKDDRSVDVPAGNAAVATTGKIELLDSVPNFMRFDPTPIPTGTPRDPLDIFRAPDGSQFGSCKVQ